MGPPTQEAPKFPAPLPFPVQVYVFQYENPCETRLILWTAAAAERAQKQPARQWHDDDDA